MHQKATFHIKYTLEGDVTVPANEVEQSKVLLRQALMQGVRMASAIVSLGPLRMDANVELKESLHVPDLVKPNGHLREVK